MNVRLASAAALIAVLMGACSETAQLEPSPVDSGPDQDCAVDGMLLAVHEGPKSQLLRADGTHAFFCDTKEIFDELLDPVRQRRVKRVWFQTLDMHTWEAHANGWAPPDSLYFVAGSRRLGAMGPTLAPFLTAAQARAFVADHGGRILRYGDINAVLLQQLRRHGMTSLE